MTDYIMSIRPQWVRRIFAGTKTVEVRKSAPRAAVSPQAPLRVWVYETKNEGGCGRLVGTFVCRKIKCLSESDLGAWTGTLKEVTVKSCLSPAALEEYMGEKGQVFAWYVEDAQRLDAPMELDKVFPSRRLPPQSWVKAPASPAIEGLV